MRKFTKCLLTLALLVLAVGVANAEKVYADLSQYGEKWDGNVLTFSWNAQWGNQLAPNLDAIGLPKGDLRNWQKLVVVVDELNNCDFFRVLVYNGDDANYSNTFKCNKTGTNEFTLSGNVTNLNNVTRICLSGSNSEDSKKDTWGETPASFKVKEVYLEKPDIVYIEASEIFEAPDGTTDIKNLTGGNYEGTGWSSTIVYPKELAVQGQAFGNGSGDKNNNKYVSIDGYDYICFNVTTATASTAGLRVWLWDDVKEEVVTLFTKPIADYATADYTVYEKITGVGTYVVNVSGYKYLKGVKAQNDYSGVTAAKVSMAYMCTGAPIAYTSTGKYSLAGEATGSATLSDALADANAVYYDATGVVGTDIDLTSVVNPNALFKANSGVLANTKNVIVDDVCANLELVDGKPFKAPVDFTATAAKFTKTMTAGLGTMVIPFAAALPTGVKAYDLTSVSGTAINTSDAASIAANKPVLLEATAGNYEFTATGAEIAATVDASTNGLLNGTYAGTTAAKAADNYVLQNASAPAFYSVTGNDANIPAFRAYLSTAAGAPSLSILLPKNGDVTGINATLVNTEKLNSEIFNLQGQRVAQPAKGLYIVNGKKVIVK